MAMEKIGKMVFLLGVLLAAVVGVVLAETTLWIAILAVAGVVVGLLNVEGHEAKTFLLAAIALLAVGSAEDSLGVLWAPLSQVLKNIGVFVAPAAIIVAAKSLWGTAASK